MFSGMLRRAVWFNLTGVAEELTVPSLFDLMMKTVGSNGQELFLLSSLALA
jgi:hypothetical protein